MNHEAIMVEKILPSHIQPTTFISGEFHLNFPAGRELDGDSRGYRSAEEQARELTRSIRREVNKLSEQWNALIERSDAWKRKLDDTANVSTIRYVCLNYYEYL